MNNANVELINHIKLIADEKRIPRDNVSDALKDAITKAYVREYPETIVEVIVDIDNKRLEVNKLLKVVEPYDDFNDYCEILLEDAKKINENVNVGEEIKEPIDLSKLDRSVVSHILQIFKSNITIQSNVQVFKEWKEKLGTVIQAEVEKVDSRSGFVVVNLGTTFGFLSNAEKIPGENLIPGQKYSFYIKDIKEQSKGWPIILSRADVGLVKYFLNLQIPEIQEKLIEIKDIARIAGFKTKVSLISHRPGIEPVGTVIGVRGSRIKTISDQINNEKIEVIEYTDDFSKYIVNVCSPAEIAGVNLQEPKEPTQKRNVILICKPEKLALLIGKHGNNVKLVSKMLNADVEVKTIKDANEEGLSYQRIDMKSLKQRTFDNTFNKYQSNNDVLNKFDSWKIDLSDLNNFKTPNQQTKSSRKEDGHEEDKAE